MRTTSVLASGLWATWLVIFGLFLATGGPLEPWRALVAVLATFGMVTVGAVIAVRRPENPIGWIFSIAGLGFLAGGSTGDYATRSLVTAPGSLPAGIAVGWVSSWIQYPTVMLVPYLLLLFPTGRLPSPRWRPIAWFGAAPMILSTVAVGFRPGALTVAPRGDVLPVTNPLALDPLGPVLTIADSLWGPLFLAMLAASVVALASRFRASRYEERQQMKWFVSSAVASLFAVVGSNFAFAPLPESLRVPLGVVVFSTAMAAFPISVAIAILRYRLYDIDVVIRRTLIYGVLSAVLLGTYVALVILFQAVLLPLTGGSELGVAASTLAVVALFQPLRSRIQDVVDRRFYRSRYDAARTLDSFTAQLSNEVDIDSLRSDLLDVIGRTVRPAHASVWFRERDGRS